MKFAVDRCLDGKKYEDAPIGSSLERVLRYWTVRGRFYRIHPALERIGVTNVIITDEGLEFCGEEATKPTLREGFEIYDEISEEENE